LSRLDWRQGERYFMEQLVDGDFASNNGGWQWSSATGTDAAPYFRIFNPYTQAERFDPDGSFIRHWVPELADAPAKSLFDPAKYPVEGYARPIVGHKAARAGGVHIRSARLRSPTAARARQVRQQPIERADDSPAAALEQMGVNLRGSQVPMPQLFLHGSDVSTISEQMGGE
jgi:hypothetical protein